MTNNGTEWESDGVKDCQVGASGEAADLSPFGVSFHVHCGACGTSYDQTSDAAPTCCGLCGAAVERGLVVGAVLRSSRAAPMTRAEAEGWADEGARELRADAAARRAIVRAEIERMMAQTEGRSVLTVDAQGAPGVVTLADLDCRISGLHFDDDREVFHVGGLNVDHASTPDGV